MIYVENLYFNLFCFLVNVDRGGDIPMVLTMDYDHDS